MCSLDGCGHHRDMPPIKVPDELRRAFLLGAATLPLAAVLADKALAAGAAATLTDVSVPVAGGRSLTGSLAIPGGSGKAPAVVIVHEWWGLNDQIKAVAAEMAQQGFLVLAVDLFGKVAEDSETARTLVQALDPAAATAGLTAAVAFLRRHERSTGKVATMGWCFGGGWALNTAIATPVEATVVYYGNVKKTAAELKPLKGPVLGHFGTLDKSINADMVAGFEKSMREAGKADILTVYWYEADHAFANPTGARYDAEDAALAWERTLFFLRKHLA
ncbi:dienelactone hydrolase family protein [Prosthecomicrobium hirschii]|uniref:dienelactone hydrolase family protein n=1 Tax=Prosthecodimorpha hirschii TaxID=665126 RepID=UPI002220A462|nr:dienelactone hydrolase family protein [Prosthecomicrobium hirschii]MCW1843590.1 dienelactone hydrolase family protein [Prosthecomicrobium hirschii]